MLINQKTSTPPATRPLVGVALLALALAGCGGGSDNADPAAPAGPSGSADGGITVKTNTDAGHGAEGAPAEGSGQNAEGSAGGESPASPGTQAISASGISTELFEQILSTQTAYVRFGQHAFPMAASYAAEQVVGWGQDGQKFDRNTWLSADDARMPFTSHQYVGTRTNQFVVDTKPFGTAGKNARQEKQLESLVHLGVTFPEGDAARDRRMVFGTTAKLEYGERDGATYAHTADLTASAEKVIPHDGVIPFDEKIQEWHGSNEHGPTGDRVSLAVEKGDKDDEVMLCTTTWAGGKPGATDPTETRAELQRKVCSEWQVPADWTATQRLNYRGIFVEEDNTTSDIGNVVNNEYYRTKPVAAGRDAEGASGVEGNDRESVTQAITQAPEEAKTAATEVEQQAEGNLSVNTASGAAQIAAEQAAAAGEDTTVQPATGGGAARPADPAPAPGGDASKPADPAPAPGGDASKPAEPAPGGDASKPADPAPGGDDAKPAEPAPAPGGDDAKPAEPAPAPGGDGAAPAEPAPAPGGDGAAPAEPAPAEPAPATPAPETPAPEAPAGDGAAGPIGDDAAADDTPSSAAATGQASNSSTSANDEPPDNDPIAALTR